MKYTPRSKGSLFIKEPYTYCAVQRSKQHGLTLTKKRYSILISRGHTLATQARLCKLEEKQRLLPWHRGRAHRDLPQRLRHRVCRVCLHEEAGAGQHVGHLEQPGQDNVETFCGCPDTCVTMKGLTWQSNSDIEGQRDTICTHRLT